MTIVYCSTIWHFESSELNKVQLLESLEHLDVVYLRASFKDEAKFGFLRMTVMKHPPVATFAMYHGTTSYEQLARAIKNFINGVHAF